MIGSLVLLRRLASKRSTLSAWTCSFESLLSRQNQSHPHFSTTGTGLGIAAGNSLSGTGGVQNLSLIRRSFQGDAALGFRAPLSPQAGYAVSDFSDEDKSRGEVGASSGDNGLDIAKLGISEQIVSAFAKKGITKLFPIQSGPSFLGRRRLSTSILTPESSDGAFPPHLLSTKRVITPDHTPGLYQDLVIPVTNFHNEDKGFMVLAGDVFDVPIRKDIVHRVVRWQLAKRQQGTHSTKTISEVSGTGRKPWPQKGTGRARHGTLRGPQFRGGATMHGPKPRSHAIKLNKKVRRLGLKIALTARAAEGKLMVFDELEVPTHKTKNIVNYVKQMENAKKFLVVDGGPIDEKLKLATQNLHYVNVLPSIGLNVYSILLHDTLVMSRDAVNRIVERMHTPINR